jgi:DNA-binding transcriptional LysR family regulator
MMEVIKKGLGLGFIPDFVCREALLKGGVVNVLADSKKATLTFYALYPARHFVPVKLVQCIEFLEGWFADKQNLTNE